MSFARNNLAQFRDVVTRAYKQAKRNGRFNDKDIERIDKRLNLGPVYTMERNGHTRKIFVDRLWRRRVARMYWRQHGKPDRGWFEDVDWNAVYNWILENIVPITRILITLVPLLL